MYTLSLSLVITIFFFLLLFLLLNKILRQTRRDGYSGESKPRWFLSHTWHHLRISHHITPDTYTSLLSLLNSYLLLPFFPFYFASSSQFHAMKKKLDTRFPAVSFFCFFALNFVSFHSFVVFLQLGIFIFLDLIELWLFGSDDNWGFLDCWGVNWVEMHDGCDWNLV
jgi:hypothetical protein